jgi:hypothetical protein
MSQPLPKYATAARFERSTVDENLPTEYASILRGAGFEADTVSDEKLSGASDSVLFEGCRAEDRILMTLDLDFANVQAYPPLASGALRGAAAVITSQGSQGELYCPK